MKFASRSCLAKIALILTISILFSGMGSGITASAKSKPSMKAANVRFNLQPGKEVTCYSDFAAIGLRPYKVKVTNIRRKMITPEIMKATITLTAKNRHKYTKNEVDRMMVDGRKWGKKGSDGLWIISTWDACFVDYETGKKLYGTVSSKITKTKIYYGKGRRYYANRSYMRDYKITASIYYGVDDKNVCFGFIGSDYWNYRGNDAFAKGEGSYKSSEMYRKKTSKKTSVWLRLN